jgi:hypothetical protein
MKISNLLLQELYTRPGNNKLRLSIDLTGLFSLLELYDTAIKPLLLFILSQATNAWKKSDEKK